LDSSRDDKKDNRVESLNFTEILPTIGQNKMRFLNKLIIRVSSLS